MPRLGSVMKFFTRSKNRINNIMKSRSLCGLAFLLQKAEQQHHVQQGNDSPDHVQEPFGIGRVFVFAHDFGGGG